MLVSLLGDAVEDGTEENVVKFVLVVNYFLQAVARTGHASLEFFWNLMVSSIEVDAVEMVFLAEFEMVVNDNLRIPFRIDFLNQSFTSLDAGTGLAKMQQVDSCIEKLFYVFCLVRYELWHSDYDPLHLIKRVFGS